MENASKALIVAGSVLLVILIIGIMIFTLNKAKSPVDQVAANMAEEERTLFNSKFNRFSGNALSGIEVKQLINVCMQNFVENSDDAGIYRIPEMEVIVASADKTHIEKKSELTRDDIRRLIQPEKELEMLEKFNEFFYMIRVHNTYNVDISYSSEGGIVSKIIVSPLKNINY